MRTVYEERVAEATKIERAIVQGTAQICSPIFGKVCKTIWPTKTAEELASRVGCAVRTAAYEIAGERDPSVQSLLVVMSEMVPKRRR
jgi:hypothetical protein